MSEDRMTVILQDAFNGHGEILRLWKWCKLKMRDGKPLHVLAKPATRSTEQNAKFHAICDEVARSGAKWAGKTRSPEEWKVLFVSGHGVATNEGAEVVSGLEEELVNLRESTARMTVARSSSLIEYTLAWCVQHEIRLQECEGAAA